MSRGIRLFAVILFGVAVSQGATCVPDLLSNYVALGTAGCTTGVFTYKDFAFSSTVLSGTPTVLTAGGISVFPAGGENVGVVFNSSGFSVSGSAGVEYLIEYTIDPPPPILRDFEMEMSTNTPVFPGLARVTAELCCGAAFVSGVCSLPGTPLSFSVFHNGSGGSDTVEGVSFDGVNVLGVRHIVRLEANGASADFTGFGATAIPEPAAWLLSASGLFMVWFRRRQQQ